MLVSFTLLGCSANSIMQQLSSWAIKMALLICKDADLQAELG